MKVSNSPKETTKGTYMIYTNAGAWTVKKRLCTDGRHLWTLERHFHRFFRLRTLQKSHHRAAKTVGKLHLCRGLSGVPRWERLVQHFRSERLRVWSRRSAIFTPSAHVQQVLLCMFDNRRSKKPLPLPFRAKFTEYDNQDCTTLDKINVHCHWSFSQTATPVANIFGNVISDSEGRDWSFIVRRTRSAITRN